MPGLAQDSATVAGVPLDISRGSTLLKQEGVLRQAYREVLEGQAGVVMAREVEVAAALGVLTKADYGESDVTLAKVAYGAGSLYALYVAVRLTAEGLLVASGRVVRNDGKHMSAGVVRANWLNGRGSTRTTREVFLQLFGQLALARLPTVKEVPAVATDAPIAIPSPDSSPPQGLPVPPSAPVLVEAPAQAAPFPMKPVGYVAMGVGLVAAVAGVVAFAAEPSFEKDALGNIREADLAAYQSARTLAGVGAGLLIGGLAVAGAGGLLVFTAPSGQPVASVGVSMAASRESVGVALGGHY